MVLPSLGAVTGPRLHKTSCKPDDAICSGIAEKSMKSILPATHLLGRLVLFTLTLIFLSTMARSAYVLWHFFDVEQSGALLAVFVTGLRNDIAAAALVCLIPASLGFLFALTTWTRFLSKAIFVITLLGGLLLLLLLELITPWFMEMQGVRPDLAAVLAVENPISEIEAAARRWPIPMAIGVLLLLMIVIAFTARLELSRLLRYRLSSSSRLWHTPSPPCLKPVHSWYSNCPITVWAKSCMASYGRFLINSQPICSLYFKS